jgi:hypothetical protein
VHEWIDGCLIIKVVDTRHKHCGIYLYWHGVKYSSLCIKKDAYEALWCYGASLFT